LIFGAIDLAGGAALIRCGEASSASQRPREAF